MADDTRRNDDAAYTDADASHEERADFRGRVEYDPDDYDERGVGVPAAVKRISWAFSLP